MKNREIYLTLGVLCFILGILSYLNSRDYFIPASSNKRIKYIVTQTDPLGDKLYFATTVKHIGNGCILFEYVTKHDSEAKEDRELTLCGNLSIIDIKKQWR